jgi:hypothetical protein
MTAIGETAPSFQLPDADDVPRGPDSGTITVVYFTSSRCPHARSWQSRLNLTAGDYLDKGVSFIAVNVPCAFPSPIAARMPKDGADGLIAARAQPEWSHVTYVQDSGLHVARAYDAQVTPDVFVLDRVMRVRYRGAPDDQWDDEAGGAIWIRAALDALLAGGDPEITTTTSVGCPIKWSAGRPLG